MWVHHVPPSAHDIRVGARFALVAKTVREKRGKKKTICFLGNEEGGGGTRGRGAAAVDGGTAGEVIVRNDRWWRGKL